MPAIGFKCKAGNVSFDECFKDCPANERCLTLPTLLKIAEQRIWKGKPSVTQLLKGTRESFLIISENFYIDPFSKLFALVGTNFHAKLENKEIPGYFSEYNIEYEGVTGQVDLYSEIEKILYDYKLYGSSTIAKILGIKKIQSGLFDNRFVIDKSKVDNFDPVMQTNFYRLALENEGKEIREIKIEAVTRDFGADSSKNKGVDFIAKMISMPIIKDDLIRRYFFQKRDALLAAVESGDCRKCSERECWGGFKCKNYCDVSNICKG